MQALILCGGKGTRLGLKSKPKPLTLINGKPLIHHTVDHLIKNGFSEIVFLSGYKGDQIKKYFDNIDIKSANLIHYIEDKPLGTSGCIRPMESVLKKWFFVIYGDLLLNIDFKRFYKFSISRGGVGSLLIHPNSHPYDSDIVEVGSNQKINKIFLKPHPKDLLVRNKVNAAVYCLNKRIIKYIPENIQSDWMADVFPKAIKKLYAYESSETVFDVGTKERITKARKLLRIQRSQNKIQAIFIDRDGVLNKEINGVYRESDLIMIKGASEAIKALNQNNILAICVTNQPGISKGFFNEEELDKVHARLEKDLSKEGSYLDDIFYCPHHPERGWQGEVKKLKKNCLCRKPGSKMFKDASKKHRVKLKKSYFISDTLKDLDACKKTGMTPILVLTGHGNKQKLINNKIKVFKNVKEAVLNILEENKC